MKTIDKWTIGKNLGRILLNALTVAGISLISQLMYYGYPPQTGQLYISLLTFVLTFLTFINRIFDEEPPTKEEKDNISVKRRNTIAKQLKSGKKHILPIFWFV